MENKEGSERESERSFDQLDVAEVATWKECDWECYARTIFSRERSLQSKERSERERDKRMFDGEVKSDDLIAIDQREYSNWRTILIRKPVEFFYSMVMDVKWDVQLQAENGNWEKEELQRSFSENDRRLKILLDSSDFQWARSKMILDAMVVGEGYMHERLVPVDILNNGQSNKIGLEFINVDWRDVWCDGLSTREDLQDAIYLFHVRPMSFLDACERWPSVKKKLEALRFNGSLKAIAEDELGEYDKGRINIMEAYFKMHLPKGKAPDLWQAQFALDQDLGKIVLLEKPSKNTYAHKQIPFTRLVFDRYRDKNQPFSPLVRNQRGITDAIANCLMQAQTAVEKSESLDHTNDYQSHLSQLFKIYEQQTGISKDLLGKTDAEIAAVSKQVKPEELKLHVPSLMDSLRNSIEGTCDRILAVISEFAGEMVYGPAENQQGQMCQIEDEKKDAYLKKIPMKSRVEEKSGPTPETYKFLSTYMIPLLKEGDSELRLSMMPTLLKILGIEDKQLNCALIDLLRLLGVSFSARWLSEEERGMVTPELEAKQQYASYVILKAAHELTTLVEEITKVGVNEEKIEELHRTIVQLKLEAEKNIKDLMQRDQEF